MLQSSEVTVIIAIFSILLQNVDCHGRIRNPPSRASMWRDGFFENPINYQDNQMFCGGFYQSLGGKCGICGDPYNKTREHEAGGKYANGILTRHYQQGTDMDIDIELTAHHKGWFEFRLCPHNSPKTPVTQSCLDQNLLELINYFPGQTRYQTPVQTADGHYRIKVRLPANIVCSQCVLQWRYHCGNNWGTDPDGTSCVGCGAQEEFYGCSDISIHSPGQVIPPNRPLPASPLVDMTGTKSKLKCSSIGAWKDDQRIDLWCTDNCETGNCPKSICKCSISTATLPNVGQSMFKACTPFGLWKHATGMVTWCENNCDDPKQCKSRCQCT